MRKLPLIILIIVILAACLIILPFTPRIVRAVKNRLYAGANGSPTVSSTSATSSNSASKNNSPGALISRNVPVFASSSQTSASGVNDASYDSTWISEGTPAWLAYNLSSVPTAKRSKVLVAWYNDVTGSYDHTVTNDAGYDVPENYTIDGNSAASVDNPPTTGWVTLATVHDNHYHSRQHVIDMAGYNWLRINITVVDGSTGNFDADINMDVYDASTALAEDWIFFGDSITAGAMGHHSLNGTSAFAQLVNAHAPDHYPVQESGGIGYTTSSDGLKYLKTWLQFFPGKYVGLSYGTNDALDCNDPALFYNTYVTMVHDVLDAGKIPLIPLIPWGRKNSIQQCAPPLNAQITKLYSAFPEIVHGPDLWSFFQSHQDLISDDNVHPNEAGFAAYRQQWANVMLTEVYHENP